MTLDWLEQKLREQHPGAWYGDIRDIFLGSGTDIADFRRYSSGDSLRNINRKMSAKHDALWVNTRHEEVDIGIHILLDINANRSGGVYQENWQLVRSWLADYILFSQRQHIHHTYIWRPEHGGGHTKKICVTTNDWIAGYNEREHCLETYRKIDIHTSILGSFLNEHVEQSRKHVYILFSDFLGLSEDMQYTLAHIDHKHTVVQMLIDVPKIMGIHK